MPIEKIGAAIAAQPPLLDHPKEQFSQLLGEARTGGSGGATAAAPGSSSAEATPSFAARAVAGPGGSRSQGPNPAEALDRVVSAQARLDVILEQARGGRSFTPAELLALQADVYRASQVLDLASRVVEKATAGARIVLQTQL